MYRPGHYVTGNGKLIAVADLRRRGFPKEVQLIAYLDALYARLMDRTNTP